MLQNLMLSFAGPAVQVRSSDCRILDSCGSGIVPRNHATKEPFLMIISTMQDKLPNVFWKFLTNDSLLTPNFNESTAYSVNTPERKDVIQATLSAGTSAFASPGRREH
jgi:hypothetical protein